MQEYWSGFSFPILGDLPKQGIKPAFLATPALAGRFFTTVPAGKSFVASIVISPLTFLLLLILFFLMSLAKGLSILFIFSELAFRCLALCYCFLCVSFVYFCSDFHDFFLSTDFGFLALLFLIVLGVKLGCLFNVSLLSCGRLVLLFAIFCNF